MSLSWREPLWFLLLLYPLLMLLWQVARQRQQSNRYADEHLLPWVQVGVKGWKHYLRRLLWTLFWLLVTLALAGPRLPLENSVSKTTAEHDIYVLVDLSRSMHARDVAPNRLARARLELHEFLRMVENSRVSIIVYAARAHQLVPLTTDYAAIDFYLHALEQLQLPTLGSDAIGALQFVEQQIGTDSVASEKAPASIIWLTDGDMAEARQKDIAKQVQTLRTKNIRLHILGVGTADGDAIPLSDDGKKWQMDRGQLVRSRLNSQWLQTLANAGNGQYASVQNDDADWQTLYQQGFVQAAQTEPGDAEQRWQELYQWALFPALFLFFLLIGAPRPWLAVLFLVLLPLPPLIFAAEPDPAIELGAQAYRGSYFAEAVEHFTGAVFNGQTDNERGLALHNLGNSYFQQGDYRAAIQVYRDSLNYRPEHKPTAHNLALAEKIQQEIERRLQLQQQAQQRRQDRGEGSGVGSGRGQGSGLSQGDNAGTSAGDERGGDENALDGEQEDTQSWGSGFGVDTILPDRPHAQQLEVLVGIGLQRLAAQGITTLQEWNRREQSLYEARLLLNQVEDNQAAMWKRLFEIEEGFPASLDAPKTVPGAEPW